ncbi:hypothetical protein HY025_04010 [Candidatus Daviesbacteria bacterium]|nr:hypothetical protein [Candidatus Daviesbacteria bacterium]
MIKILPIILIVGVILGALLYIRFFQNQTNIKIASLTSTAQSTDSSDLKDRVGKLDDSVVTLAKQIVSINSILAKPGVVESSNNSALSLEARVAALETGLADVKVSLALLKATPAPATSQTSSTSTPSYPVYIPLGSGGQIGDRNWNSTGTYQATIDPGNYSGYKNMQLEINTQMIQSVGQANFRLFNSSDNSAVSGSDISTTSSSYVWITSNSFTLASGSKTYVLQIQSTQGYNINVQNARIKVNF